MVNQILDCTLRDGAHINGGKFGVEKANAIVQALIDSGVQMIELGFLEPKRAGDGTTFFQSIGQCAEFYSKNERGKGVKFGLMLRTDRCPMSALSTNSFLQFIRIAFYPEHLEETKKYLLHAKELGYETYANLISITGYPKSEIRRIISDLNAVAIDGISIVDTYGALDRKEMCSLIALFDDSLAEDISLGVHLHENLSESVSMIDAFYEAKINRCKTYDGALGGMGRVPGNIPTELIANYLNKVSESNFQIDVLLNAAASHVFPFKKVSTWGYLPIYAYSAIKRIDRSYPEYFEACGLSENENMQCQDAVARSQPGAKFCEDMAKRALQAQGFGAVVRGRTAS